MIERAAKERDPLKMPVAAVLMQRRTPVGFPCWRRLSASCARRSHCHTGPAAPLFLDEQARPSNTPRKKSLKSDEAVAASGSENSPVWRASRRVSISCADRARGGQFVLAQPNDVLSISIAELAFRVGSASRPWHGS